MLEFVIALIAGALVKTVDWLDDTKKSKNPVKFLLAALYGAAIGYLISLPQLSAIFLAALAAQIVARKVDTTAHRLGFVVAALSLFAFSFPTVEPLLFLFFAIMAVLDEMDYLGRLRPLVEYRPFLKIGSIIPLAWGAWGYFAGIIAFDIGYEAVTILTKSREAEANASARPASPARPAKNRNP
jgi:hypothetical protein